MIPRTSKFYLPIAWRISIPPAYLPLAQGRKPRHGLGGTEEVVAVIRRRITLEIQRAAEIANLKSGDTGDKPVGDFGWEPAVQESILALLPPTVGQVEALLEFVDHH